MLTWELAWFCPFCLYDLDYSRSHIASPKNQKGQTKGRSPKQRLLRPQGLFCSFYGWGRLGASTEPKLKMRSLRQLGVLGLLPRDHPVSFPNSLLTHISTVCAMATVTYTNYYSVFFSLNFIKKLPATVPGKVRIRIE